VATAKLKPISWHQCLCVTKEIYFERVNGYLEKLGKVVSENVKQYITEHHRQLQNSFEEYFPPNNDNNWMKNPFSGSIQKEDSHLMKMSS
jgi:intein/homing endonuclease